MKILAIVGSMRDGNSNYLVNEAIRQIQGKKSIRIDKIHLKDISMNFCNGCLICDETGSCVFNDDLSALISEIRNTDAFIMATPARWGLLSGEMKTFIDRLNPLAMKEELKGKKTIIIAVGQSESNESRSIELAAKSIETFCSDAGIEVVDTIIVCGCYEKDDAKKQKDYIEKCSMAMQRLIE